MLKSRAVTPPPSADLTVQIGALRLANPVIAASGTFGYGVEFAPLLDLNRLGGFVVKGLSLAPMAGAPAPRLVETPSGMLNAVGLQNIGARAFVAEKLPALRGYRTAIIANVFGCTVEEYVQVLRILEDAEGLAGYELNISCPNTAHGGLQFGSDPAMVSEVVGAARAAARRPLWVKLSQGKVKLDADKEALFYQHTWDYLGAAGYAQYEVSNFGDCACRRSCRSRCAHRGQHLSGHERGHSHAQVQPRTRHRRPLRAGD